MHGSIEITGKRVTRFVRGRYFRRGSIANNKVIDLSGFILMPGLINAHDHLEFALYPRLASPPYRSYIDWGEDIHDRFPEVIARHRAVPKDVRLWWGGIRNLICGVTTVCHHNPLWAELRSENFPVRVVQEYGWGHSFALGGDLRGARASTPEGRAFIVHACEGVDGIARKEIWDLDRLGLLDDYTVLVHGLALDQEGVALIRDRGASLVVCPSSNQFLFGRLPDLSLLGKVENLVLGNDSPLTAEGNLLDEIRFAMQFCQVSPQTAYRMVTTAPAAVFRLQDGEGSIEAGGVADLLAVRDTGLEPTERLRSLSIDDVEFVMVGGEVRLASEDVLERLPLSIRQGLEPLLVDGTIRWLRAPIEKLLEEAEAVLGKGEVRLGARELRAPACAETGHAC
jgi:cytosine/adenosine deaminase-related metal-dependent hydrolase